MSIRNIPIILGAVVALVLTPFVVALVFDVIRLFDRFP